MLRSILLWKNAGKTTISFYKFKKVILSTIFHFRYYPKGGGYCKIDVRPIKSLNAFQLLEFGDISDIFGWSFVAGTLPIHVIEFNLE